MRWQTGKDADFPNKYCSCKATTWPAIICLGLGIQLGRNIYRAIKFFTRHSQQQFLLELVWGGFNAGLVWPHGCLCTQSSAVSSQESSGKWLLAHSLRTPIIALRVSIIDIAHVSTRY